MKVLIGPSTFAELDETPLRVLRGAGFEVIPNPFCRKLTKEELLDLLPGVSGLIAGLETLDREVLEKSELKVISRCGSGLSNIDLGAAEELGIVVKSTPQAPVTAVAELTIGCLIALLRQVPRMDRALHRREWQKIVGRQLKGMKVAVIGFGQIGQKVGEMLSALGAHVLAVDPGFTGQKDDIPVIGLDEALPQADVVSIHCSGEGCLLGEREFSLMKQGAYILNAARGGLIDEQALKQALDSGKAAGAWLDTFSEEPYQGILCDYDQVILTPHIGSYTLECRKEMETEAVENLIAALRRRETNANPS